MQHDVLLESIAETVQQDEDSNDNTDKIAEADEVEIDSPAIILDINLEPNSMAETSVEDISDEDVDDNINQDDSAHVARYVKVSKPCDYSNHLIEMAHAQKGTTEGR